MAEVKPCGSMQRAQPLLRCTLRKRTITSWEQSTEAPQSALAAFPPLLPTASKLQSIGLELPGREGERDRERARPTRLPPSLPCSTCFESCGKWRKRRGACLTAEAAVGTGSPSHRVLPPSSSGCHAPLARLEPLVQDPIWDLVHLNLSHHWYIGPSVKLARHSFIMSNCNASSNLSSDGKQLRLQPLPLSATASLLLSAPPLPREAVLAIAQ